jgi:hypothetical protein
LRARFQKCAYWEGDPAKWELVWYGDMPVLELDCENGVDGVEEMCKCPDHYGCRPYKTLHNDMIAGLPDMIQWTWAEANTIICNGAKPECPCYTGKWNYVIDAKMRDGMRITSNQILELRYWAEDWDNQLEYEEAFTLKPGPDQGPYTDPSTDVIFTFDRWDNFNATDPNESVMQGRSSKLIIGSGGLVGRSFSAKDMVLLNKLEYPRADETGTMVQKGVTQSYPTLVRDLDGQGFDRFLLPPFTVVYPGDAFSFDKSYCRHNVVWMDKEPGVAIIGSSTPGATIYAVNITGMGGGLGFMDLRPGYDREKEQEDLLNNFFNHSSKNRLPREKWPEFNEKVKTWLDYVRRNYLDRYATSQADPTGAFYFGPLKVKHQGRNKIVIITDYSGYNDYDFKVRTAYSSFWGSWIIQKDFESALPEDSEEGVFPSSPYSFSPPAEVKFTTGSIQGKIAIEDVFPVTATMSYGVMGNVALVSYYITQQSEDVTSEYWTQVYGNPSHIWADIGSINVNLLHTTKINSVFLTLKEEDEDEENESKRNINLCIEDFLMSVDYQIRLEIVYPEFYKPTVAEEGSLKREHSHPKYVLLRTPLITYKKGENGGWSFSNYGTAPDDGGTYYTQRLMANFSKEDWDLTFSISYQKMEFVKGEEEEDEAGEGLEPEEGEDPLNDPENQPDFGESDPDFEIPEEEGEEEGAVGNQVWPPPGSAMYRVVPNALVIEQDAGDVYKIDGWKTHTAAVFCYNSDDEGRYWSAAATKLIGQMNYLECKNVDIMYAYKAPAKAYDLLPSTGFFTWMGAPKVVPAAGGDAGGGGSGGNGDDPGAGDESPGSPDSETWKLGAHAGGSANELHKDVFDAPSFYDSGSKSHYRIAKCGDHDCNPGNCIGPMWYPFNTCTNVDFYNIHTGPGACTASLVPEMDRPIAPNFRYGVADHFIPSVTTGGNWASSCGGEWFYHYSEAAGTGMQFAGYARVRGRVFRKDYAEQGWMLPPFGLTGRPYVERFMTRDWASHLMPIYGGAGWVTVFEFMPYVLDKVDLEAYLNCFEDVDQDNPIDEPFIHSSTLSWLTLSSFKDGPGEIMPNPDSDRFRFEEVLNVVWHGLCMYPHPLFAAEMGYRVARYGFAREDITWVWRERWKDLERQTSTSDNPRDISAKLFFMDLEQPQYYMDKFKQEHRLVTSEGPRVMTYTGPNPTQEEIEEAAQKGEEAPDMKYPSVSLGASTPPRFFRILYDINDYGPELVDWKDEGNQGVASGSGGDTLSDEETADKVEEEASGEADGGPEGGQSGEDSGNMYERANDPPGTPIESRLWLHDFNTLFDEEADPETSEERAAVYGIDLDGQPIYKYYNQGLIATIPKNRLHWLPMSLVIGGKGRQGRDNDQPDYAGCSVWSYKAGNDPLWTWLPEELTATTENPLEEITEVKNVTPYKLTIRGQWGYRIDKETKTPIFYCQPRYHVDEEYGGITTNTDIEIPESVNQPFSLANLVEGFGEDGVVVYKEASQEQRQNPLMKSYEIEIFLDPWPYRMLASKKLFTLHLGIIPDNLLAVSSIDLICVEYQGTEAENIKVWERKYLPATSSSTSAGNPDGPDTKSYRNFDTAFRHAGQYYPATNIGAPVGNFKDKMVIISSGPYTDHDQNVSIEVSMENLKSVEKNKQRELYEFAFNLDDYDTTTYKQNTPSVISQFVQENSIPFWYPSSLVSFNSQKIDWDMLGYQKIFIEDMDFWQPEGHFFQWSDTGTITRCYLFGGKRNVFTANFVHAHSGSSNRVAPPGHAYKGWVRKEYHEGRLAQLGALGRGAGAGDWTAADGLTAGVNKVGLTAR